MQNEEYLQMESDLYKWFLEQCESNLNITWHVLKEKAMQLHEKYCSECEFNASRDWLDKFMKTHDLHYLRENSSTDQNVESLFKKLSDGITKVNLQSKSDESSVLRSEKSTKNGLQEIKEICNKLQKIKQEVADPTEKEMYLPLDSNESSALKNIIETPNCKVANLPKKPIKVPFWNGELQVLRKKKIKFRRLFQRARPKKIDPHLIEIKEANYKTIRKEYARKIKEAKEKTLKQFLVQNENVKAEMKQEMKKEMVKVEPKADLDEETY